MSKIASSCSVIQARALREVLKTHPQLTEEDINFSINHICSILSSKPSTNIAPVCGNIAPIVPLNISPPSGIPTIPSKNVNSSSGIPGIPGVPVQKQIQPLPLTQSIPQNSLNSQNSLNPLNSLNQQNVLN